ncbi:MAG: Fe-S cluster assembly protein SufD [Crocinitomicaceae bacterium]|nr:Fe-S cluster assembly protein SufD [Crocinitomicaceae bacterium]
METIATSTKEQLLYSLETSIVSSIDHLHPEISASAKETLKALEFPSTRQEEWKYSRTTRISSESWEVRKSSATYDISSFRIKDIDADEIVFINGFFCPDLSTVRNNGAISVLPFSQLDGQLKQQALNNIGSETSRHNSFFTALNTAYCTDGIFFFVQKNTVVHRPIHFLFLQEGERTLAMPRISGIVGSGSKMHIVTSYGSLDQKKAWNNAVIEITIEQNASLTFDKVQLEGDQNFSIINEFFRQHKDSRFSISTLTVDGGWVRNNLNIFLDGTHCESHLNGFYLPRGNQHIDNHTLVDHLLPHCESNELYKGVIYDRGKAVFNGKVFVRPDAQKTNAYQNNANIMMSDDATVNTKPELEIYADDVKCSHGTTTGRFDESALFYLRARGLGEESARKMLSSAFIGEVLNKVDNQFVRMYVQDILTTRGLWV